MPREVIGLRTVNRRSAGLRSTAEGDARPAIAERERLRQAQDESSHRGDDLDADLEEFEPQGGDLSARPVGTSSSETDLLQQSIGRGGEQHAQLIGEEPRTAGAIKRDVKQLLDPVLDLAALAVDPLIDAAG